MAEYLYKSYTALYPSNISSSTHHESQLTLIA